MQSAVDFSRRLNAKGFCSEEKNRPKKSPRISSLCYLTKRSAMSAPSAGSRQGQEQRMWSCWREKRCWAAFNSIIKEALPNVEALSFSVLLSIALRQARDDGYIVVTNQKTN